MPLHALFLNCTLKPSPDASNTQALIDRVAAMMEQRGVTTKTVRIADEDVGTGISSDLGPGDGWPAVLEQVLACDILVIGTPIWLGHMSSIAQRVIERLDDTFSAYDPDNGQFPLYDTVGAVIVTGNEDGAQSTSAEVLYALQSLGCTIPPNSDVYWVGDAGPGPSYIAADATRHFYTNKIAAWMAANTVWMAELLHAHPCPTNLLALADEMRLISDAPKPDPHEADRVARETARQTSEQPG